MKRRFLPALAALAVLLGAGVVTAPAASAAVTQEAGAYKTKCDSSNRCVTIKVWLERYQNTYWRPKIEVYCYTPGGPVLACRAITYDFGKVLERSIYSPGVEHDRSYVYGVTCTSSCPVSKNQRTGPWVAMTTSPPPAPGDRQQRAETTATACPRTGTECFDINDGLYATTVWVGY